MMEAEAYSEAMIAINQKIKATDQIIHNMQVKLMIKLFL